MASISNPDSPRETLSACVMRASSGKVSVSSTSSDSSASSSGVGSGSFLVAAFSLRVLSSGELFGFGRTTLAPGRERLNGLGSYRFSRRSRGIV